MGYPDTQLREILGDDYAKFSEWMRGQTGAICDGTVYSHEHKRYYATPCKKNPHGAVVYGHDLRRFLAGLPVVD